MENRDRELLDELKRRREEQSRTDKSPSLNNLFGDNNKPVSLGVLLTVIVYVVTMIIATAIWWADTNNELKALVKRDEELTVSCENVELQVKELKATFREIDKDYYNNLMTIDTQQQLFKQGVETSVNRLNVDFQRLQEELRQLLRKSDTSTSETKNMEFRLRILEDRIESLRNSINDK